MVASLSFWMTGCSDDDDTGGGGTVVEDGLYVKGAGTGFADFSTKALFKVTKNDVLQMDLTSSMSPVQPAPPTGLVLTSKK